VSRGTFGEVEAVRLAVDGEGDSLQRVQVVAQVRCDIHIPVGYQVADGLQQMLEAVTSFHIAVRHPALTRARGGSARFSVSNTRRRAPLAHGGGGRTARSAVVARSATALAHSPGGTDRLPHQYAALHDAALRRPGGPGGVEQGVA
jgi:hypothetical protein